MAEQKESSVLFSLKELMSLEEDRIRAEEAERRRQADIAEQARLEVERRSREEEERRMSAQEERRRAEDQRTREEQARLDAIRHAEVEKARLDAENAARMEAMRRQQEHEHHLATLSQDKTKKNLKYAAIGTGLVLVLSVVGGGLLIKSQNEEREQERAKAAAELQQTQEKIAELERKQAAQDQLVKETERQLANATNEAERKAAAEKLDRARQDRDATRRTIQQTPGGGGSKAGSAPAPACTCTKGDPLCACIN